MPNTYKLIKDANAHPGDFSKFIKAYNSVMRAHKATGKSTSMAFNLLQSHKNYNTFLEQLSNSI